MAEELNAALRQIHDLLAGAEPARARGALEQLLQQHPEDVTLLSNLTAVCMQLGDKQAALHWARRAFELAPLDHRAQMHMGHLLLEARRFVQAGQYYRLAVDSDDTDTEAWLQLAHCQGKQGQARRSLKVLARALEQHPDDAQLQGRFFYHQLALPDQSTLAQHFSAWNARLDTPARPFANAPDPERRLRIGYVSGDLRESVAAQVIGPLFDCRDKTAYDLFVYANVQRSDDWTRWFAHRSDHWREIQALTDRAVAEQVLTDRIDILVDLNGQMPGNRLPVFALRPAPLQLTGPGGYLSTTGLAAIDYVLADAWMVPPQQAALHSESPVHLRSGFHWQPRAECLNLPLSEAPSVRNGYVTFGCGNDTLKLNERVIALWARLLQALPSAGLLLKADGFDEPALRHRFSDYFAAQGIDAARLGFEGRTSPQRHLAFYDRIDVALDPFPYNGAVSTCDALWMGTPVVCLYDQQSRVSASILAAIGTEDWIARDEEAYLQIALRFAAEVAWRQSLKRGLRQRLLGSPVCDGPGFCRELETVYRQLWRQWCQEQA